MKKNVLYILALAFLGTFVTLVMVYFSFFSSTETPVFTTGQINSAPISRKVLAVVYYKGHNPSQNFNYTQLINETESFLEQGSVFHQYKNGGTVPSVSLQVTTQVLNKTAPQRGSNCDQYLPKIWANQWTTQDWVNTQCWGSGTADYVAMLNEVNFCNQVNQGVYDEVWFIAFGYGGFWEAVMTGPGSYWTNGTPITGTTCQKPVHIMGLTYERATSLALHSFGHRFEGTMKHFLQDEYLAWDTRNDMYNQPMGTTFPMPSFAGCGNVHWAPNGQQHYQLNNPAYVQTDCEDWNINRTGQRKTINCSTWGCNELGYMVWWMQNMPGLNNGLTKRNGTPMPNWWEYLWYGGLLPTPTPTATATATPTVAVTATATPTASPTATIAITVTATPTASPTVVITTIAPTITSTQTPTASPTIVPTTIKVTPTPTKTPTQPPTQTPTTLTLSPTSTVTATVPPTPSTTVPLVIVTLPVTPTSQVSAAPSVIVTQPPNTLDESDHVAEDIKRADAPSENTGNEFSGVQTILLGVIGILVTAVIIAGAWMGWIWWKGRK